MGEDRDPLMGFMVQAARQAKPGSKFAKDIKRLMNAKTIPLNIKDDPNRVFRVGDFSWLAVDGQQPVRAVICLPDKNGDATNQNIGIVLDKPGETPPAGSWAWNGHLTLPTLRPSIKWPGHGEYRVTDGKLICKPEVLP